MTFVAQSLLTIVVTIVSSRVLAFTQPTVTPSAIVVPLALVRPLTTALLLPPTVTTVTTTTRRTTFGLLNNRKLLRPHFAKRDNKSDDSNDGDAASPSPPRRRRRNNPKLEHNIVKEGEDTDVVMGQNTTSETTTTVPTLTPVVSTSTTSTSTSSSSSKATRSLERKIRAAAAQAEIDRILNGPDPPFDMERAQVTSMAPLSVESLAVAELDAKESQLEKDLYQAVKRHDYDTAAALKHDIQQMHLDDSCSVLAVNSEFYRAFSNKDLAVMQALWLPDESVVCIHPSCKPLLGANAVFQSWSRLFQLASHATGGTVATRTGAAERCWMEPHDIRLSVKGPSTAVVTCEEHVFVRRFVRGQRRQSELINKLTATNIFRKVNNKWYLFHHHASWHADSEAAQAALKKSSGGGGVVVSANTPTTSLSQSLSTRRKQVKSWSNPNTKKDDDNSIGMDGILGTSKFGPLLGDGKKKGADGKPNKRIFMGSFADMLNANLGDMMGSEDDSNADDDESSKPYGTLHFRFKQVDDEDDGGDNIDIEVSVDEDAEDDDEDDEDDDEEDEIELSVDTTVDTDLLKQLKDSSSSTKIKSSATKDSSPPKDALRQDCIAALRKLCEKGVLSNKHKRVLLTDIISCSANGEFSKVEVAYELLMSSENDDDEERKKYKDMAEEEFADQCRLLAMSFPEPQFEPTNSSSST